MGMPETDMNDNGFDIRFALALSPSSTATEPVQQQSQPVDLLGFAASPEPLTKPAQCHVNISEGFDLLGLSTNSTASASNPIDRSSCDLLDFTTSSTVNPGLAWQPISTSS